MKNSEIANRLKELRKRKGFSQDEVAGKAQISLRTVQRIENGETEPRGDTLHRMAHVLGFTPEDLLTQKNTSAGLTILLNLSALSFFLHPVLGVFVPALIWLFKKEEDKQLSELGKKLLNFEITWCLLLTLIYLIAFGKEILHLNIPMPTFDFIGRSELFILLNGFLYAVNGIFLLFNAYRSYHQKTIFFSPAIPFLR